MAATPKDMNDGFINFYEVLGLQDLESDKNEIRKAYLKQTKIHHPDKRGGDDEQFKCIKAACEILSNDSRHKLYQTEFCLRQQPSVYYIPPSQYDYQGKDLALKIYTHQVESFKATFINPSAGFRHYAPTRDQVFCRGFSIRPLATAQIESSQFNMMVHSGDNASYFRIFCKEFMLCDKEGLVIGMFSLENSGQVSLTLVNENFDPQVIRQQLDAHYNEINEHLREAVPTWFKSENLQINREIFLFERLKAQDEIVRLRSLTGPFSSYGAQEKADRIETALKNDSKKDLMLALEHQRLPIAFKGITAFNNFQADEATEGNSAQNAAKPAPTR